MESTTAAQNATFAEMFAPSVGALGIGSEMLLSAATELTKFDLSSLISAVERIPMGLSAFTHSVEALPDRLNAVLSDIFAQLPDFSLLQQPQLPQNLTLMIDSEQIVTPQFTEKVSDQLSVNAQSGGGRR